MKTKVGKKYKKKEQIRLSYFLIGCILKLIQPFILNFSRKQKDSRVIIFLIKYGNNLSRNFILASLSLNILEIVKNKFGSRVVIQLIRYLHQKRELLLFLVNYKIFYFLSFRYSSQIVDIFFQYINSAKERDSVVFALFFFNDFNYSIYYCKFYKVIGTARSFYSGFYKGIKEKLKNIFRNHMSFLNKNALKFSPTISSTIILEYMRIFHRYRSTSLQKIICIYGVVLSNSYNGLLLISQCLYYFNSKSFYIFLKSICKNMSKILKNKFSYMLIILILNKEYKKTPKICNAFNIKEIICSDVNLHFKYSRFIYLYLIKPFSKIILKKNIYKLLINESEKKTDRSSFNKIGLRLNKRQKNNFYKLLTNLLKKPIISTKQNQLHMVSRQFLEEITYVKNYNEIQFFKDFEREKIRERQTLFGFSKNENVFLSLLNISHEKKKTVSKFLIFELILLCFCKLFRKDILIFHSIRFFRCFLYSCFKKKNEMNKDNCKLRIHLPLKNTKENMTEFQLLYKVTI
nr:hypothetical protein 1634Bnrm2_p153 [Cryptomonas sp.]